MNVTPSPVAVASSNPLQSEWSLEAAAFARGEVLSFPWAFPASHQAGAEAARPRGSGPAIVVVAHPGAASERLTVIRGPDAGDATGCRLLVWATLPTNAGSQVPGVAGPDAADGAARDRGPGDLQGPAILLAFRVPEEAFKRLSIAMGTASRIACRPGVMSELCHRYLRTLAGAGQVPIGPGAELIGRQVAELVQAAIVRPSCSAVADEKVRDRRAANVLAVVHAHCADPELTPDGVAARLGISVRYVHRLLHDIGCRFGEELIRARLELAHAMLTEHHGRKVIDVAFDCGFKDVTHFSRRFKALFGVTPREAMGRSEQADGAEEMRAAQSAARVVAFQRPHREASVGGPDDRALRQPRARPRASEG